MKQEYIHATAISIDGHGILLTGDTGAGKSDLALRLIDRGAILVSDDQVSLSNENGNLMLSCAERIAGKLEVFGIGIIQCETAQQTALKLCIKLSEQAERYPMDRQLETIAGIAIPAIRLYAKEPSAPIKVEIALKKILQGTQK